MELLRNSRSQARTAFDTSTNCEVFTMRTLSIFLLHHMLRDELNAREAIVFHLAQLAAYAERRGKRRRVFLGKVIPAMWLERITAELMAECPKGIEVGELLRHHLEQGTSGWTPANWQATTTRARERLEWPMPIMEQALENARTLLNLGITELPIQDDADEGDAHRLAQSLNLFAAITTRRLFDGPDEAEE